MLDCQFIPMILPKNRLKGNVKDRYARLIGHKRVRASPITNDVVGSGSRSNAMCNDDRDYRNLETVENPGSMIEGFESVSAALR